MGGLAIGVSGLAQASTFVAPTVHALFVETDGTAGNQILSYARGIDGTVSLAGKYATGGLGATAVGATADPLASQGGLALVHSTVGTQLIATNAGSNSLSLFDVNGTSLTLVQKINSGGEFPNSIAVHGAWVTALNAGGDGTVAEFQLVNGHLVAVKNQVRDLNLANTNPPNYVKGPGEVAYTPNGRFRVVTDKNSTNDFQVFTVSATGVLASSPTVTPAANDVPFAFVFDPNGNIVDAEASNSSVAAYSIGTTGALTLLGQASDSAHALCWISTARGFYFGSNAGSSTISSFTVSSEGVVSLVNADAATTQAGTTDSVVSPDGHYLYAENGGAGALDVYYVTSTGVLAPLETVWNLPLAAEGLAVS